MASSSFVASPVNEELPSLPPVTNLSTNITRILGQNPGPFTLQGTNSYLIGHGSDCILIDTTEPFKPLYVETLKNVLIETGRSINHILISHWHGDHVGSVQEVQDMCFGLTKHRPAVHKFATASTRVSFPLPDAHRLTDGQEFNVGKGCTIRVVFTPGHTDDHTCFLLVEDGILFSGDCILGHGTTYLEFLPEYLKTLKKLQDMSAAFNQIYPAHGDVVKNPVAKINEYLEHRLRRIQEVFQYLSDSKDWISEVNLLELTYQGVPEAKRRAALSNQRQSLNCLKDQGRAECEERTSQDSSNLTTPETVLVWRAILHKI